MERSLFELQTDVAVTVQQARKYYALKRRDALAHGALSVVRYVAPHTHSYGKAERREFLVLSPELSSVEGHRLRHLAGTAAVRHALGAPAEEWFSDAGAPDATFVPDAIWNGPDGPVGVEYDASGYTRETILNKGAAFEEYEGGQVWGVAAAKRVELVESLLREVAPNARVIHAPWC